MPYLPPRKRHKRRVNEWTDHAFPLDLERNRCSLCVADSSEGRWTVAEAIDLDVAAPAITLSLLQRLRSRDADSFSDKLLSALRNEFGGHAIKKD